ncbi:hypothetical protein KY343_00570 [Candidatus Woesearchaeota archaeon]|nr:hypothetical protein [Candidatus Woesearchaeota archaeon]
MLKKKGQITIFIIGGIILLLLVALFLYVRSFRVEKVPAAPTVEEVPTQLDPVRTYMQDCLRETTVNGFNLLGARAGYVNPEEYGITSNPNDPTSSNAVSFFPDDPNSPPVAYWQYFKSRNTCLENCACGSKQPPLCKPDRKDCFSRGENSIEAQLENYIADNIGFCIKNFADLAEQGFQIEETGEIEPEVTITKSAVRVYLRYPLQTEKEDTKETIPDFYTELQFNFMKIYEFASQIAKAKQLYHFFERWTMTIIEGVGGLNSAIPKTYSVDFSPGTTERWSKSKIKEQITNNILPGYTSVLRVYNTQNFRPMTFQNEIATGIYRYRDLPIGSTQDFSFSDLKVNFHYFPHWPIYFEMDGRGVEGDLITAEQGSAFETFFSWLGLKRYQYYYDISYPVIVEITDNTQKAKNIFGPNGYKFQFALEANIRDNEELNCSGPGLVLTTKPLSSNLCKQIHFKSGDTIIETRDDQGNPVPDVYIIYQCGKQTGCSIGYTEIETNSSSPYFGRAILSTKLPYPCVGGYLTAKKHHYFMDPLQYNTAPVRNDSIVLELMKVRTVNAAVAKLRVIKSMDDWQAAPGFSNLLPNEQAVITLERIRPNFAAEDFTKVVSVEGNTPSRVDLIPGDYKISGLLVYNLPALNRNEIVFKDEYECAGLEMGDICLGDTVTLHIDPFNDSFMEGGIELENINIPASYLDNYDTLYFKVVSIPDSSSFNLLSFSDIELMGQYSTWSGSLASELQPDPTVFTFDYAATGGENPMWELTE